MNCLQLLGATIAMVTICALLSHAKVYENVSCGARKHQVGIYVFSIFKTIYASAFRRRRNYVFGLSVRPSLRPSARPSVRPSEAWNALFSPVHGSVCPSDQPWPFCGMSVRLSVRPAVRPSVRLSWEVSGHLPRTHEGMNWIFACWCTLATIRTVQFMVTVCWFFKFWRYFDSVKQAKFGVSVHLLENARREWPKILHVDVSWQPSELVSLWSWSVEFSNFGTILT